MNSPSRNIPISTVMVAATVVERFAPSERHASETKSLNRPLNAVSAPSSLRSVSSAPSSLCSFVPAAALVAREATTFELDHALAHLVDHLAVVRHHQDRRAAAVDAIEELHDPDGGVG